MNSFWSGGRARSVDPINHATLFCSGGRSSLTRITLNTPFEKFTQLLFQGDGFGEAASHQLSSRDFNRVFFSLSADTPELRRPWAVSSPSGAIAADALKAPRIAWRCEGS